MEKGGRGWTAVLNPGQVFGVGEEAGLEVEEELCGVDVDHFFSADEGCCLAGRTKDTDSCLSI